MAINQFTSQSAWISLANSVDASLVIAESDQWTEIVLSEVDILSRYNFAEPDVDIPQLMPDLKGVFLIQASMTTSGAVNHSLSFRAGFGNGGASFTYPPNVLTYDSKGGNEWCVNYNAIMQIYDVDVGTDRFIFEGRNNTASNNIQYNYLNLSVIKLY